MKTCLVTLNINNFLRPNSRDSFHDACRRWQCDYLEITGCLEGIHIHANKLKAFDLCDADRIMYIDADTVISAGCPNPFEMFPEDAFVACNNQQDQMPESSINACADTIARDLRTINEGRPDVEPIGNYPDKFINSGFWIASREHHEHVLKFALEISINMFGKTAWKDQSALNYALLYLKIPVNIAPDTWNYQYPPDSKTGAMEQLIYHWTNAENRQQIEYVNWRSFKARQNVRITSKPRLLWVGDATVDTGFARVTHNVLEVLRHKWDVYCVGLNYAGDPHSYPYPIWPARNGGDIWGIAECAAVMNITKPDLVVVLNDPWIVVRFATEIKRGRLPMAAYIPIDARNQNPFTCARLNDLDLAVFYTEFGERQCRLGGFKGKSQIIPHGVDTEIYYPIDKKNARARLNLFDYKENEVDLSGNGVFIVGNLNRNQLRKRLDLTVQYFAEWIRRVAGSRRQRIDDAYLYLHCSREDPMGWELDELAYYYGIANRVILPDESIVSPAYGLPEEQMPYVYGSFDVQVTTSAGEGWGLPQIEGMACGIPQIAPNNSAMGEWMAGAAWLLPVADECITHPVINTVGQVPIKEEFIRALDMFYRNPKLRQEYSFKALTHARNTKFTWANVGKLFNECLTEMLVENNERLQARNQRAEISKERLQLTTA